MYTWISLYFHFILKAIFSGYRILDRKLFFLGQCFKDVAPLSSGLQSFIFVPLYVMCPHNSYPRAFKIFFLSLILWCSLAWFLYDYFYLVSLSILSLRVYTSNFHQILTISAIISLKMFSVIFTHFIWYSVIHVLDHLMLFHLSLMLFIFFQSFFSLCFILERYYCFKFTDLSSVVSNCY